MSREYWDQYAENPGHNEEMAKFIRDLAISLRAQNVLEIGCSSGSDLRLFPKGFDVSGIDSNERAIEQASRNLPDSKFKLGLSTELPFGDASFDFVFTRNVLNYLETDIEKSVNEMFRVSRKYILNIESFSENEDKIKYEPVPMWGRNMYRRWRNFGVKIISNVDMHEEIDPEKSKFTLVRKI